MRLNSDWSREGERFEERYGVTTFKHAPNWPEVAVFDVRLAVVWFFVIPFPLLMYPALVVSGVFALAKFLGTTPQQLRRVVTGHLVGNVLHATRIAKQVGVPMLPQLALVATLSLAAFSPKASAGFWLFTPEPEFPSLYDSGANLPNLDDRAINPFVEGFGKGVHLWTAMEQLLPPGWEVQYASPDFRDIQTSWVGDRKLASVLDDLAAQSGLDLIADFPGRRLVVAPANGRGQLHLGEVNPATVSRAAAMAPDGVAPLPRGVSARAAGGGYVHNADSVGSAIAYSDSQLRATSPVAPVDIGAYTAEISGLSAAGALPVPDRRYTSDDVASSVYSREAPAVDPVEISALQAEIDAIDAELASLGLATAADAPVAATSYAGSHVGHGNLPMNTGANAVYARKTSHTQRNPTFAFDGPGAKEAFLDEKVSVDIRGAVLEQALRAVVPPGFMVEIAANEPRLSQLQVDTTFSGTRRREVFRSLLQPLGLRAEPFVEFSKIIVTR